MGLENYPEFIEEYKQSKKYKLKDYLKSV